MRKPIIVWTTDDGFTTDYTILYDLLRSRGLVGTSYVIGDRIGRGTLQGSYATWAHWNKMVEMGWDVQCHTFDHPYLTQLTSEQVEEEFIKNDEILTRHGIAKPNHTAFPYGDHNQMVRDIAWKYRKTIRDTGYSLTQYNSYADVRHGYLKGLRADIKDEGYFQTVKQVIDEAIPNNRVIILYHHEIIEGQADYKATLGYLVKLLDYIEYKGIQTMTLSQAYQYVLNTLSNE